MFTRITNEFGVLTYRRGMLEQVIRHAFAPFRNQCWPAKYIPGSADSAKAGKLDPPVCTAEMTDRGVLIRISVVMRFGVPIRSTLASIIDSIAASVTDSLELPLDNVVLTLTAVAAKGVSARDITMDYLGSYSNAKEEAAEDESWTAGISDVDL